MTKETYKIEYLELAKIDIENITTYIKYNLQNKTASQKLVYKIIDNIKSIATFPYANQEYILKGKINNHFRSKKVNNFLVFYIVNENLKKIIIVRILHQKQNIQSLLTEGEN